MAIRHGTIKVGSRDSALAVIQARLVMDMIRSRHPEIGLELVTLKTTGDKILDKTLDQIGGKGLFVKELDEALADGRVDFCVHSHKDLPTPDNPRLPVVATPAREDPRDVLVLPRDAHAPDRSRPLGTSSARRRVQLAGLYPDWECAPVRGNIQTRLAKLDAGLYGGLVLAAAGIRRLGLWERVYRAFEVTEMIPAAGQGILAIQGRAGEDYWYLDDLTNAEAADAARAERAFIAALDGGCSAPIAAHAALTGETVRLSGMHVANDGDIRTGKLAGPRAEAERIGRELAARLL